MLRTGLVLVALALVPATAGAQWLPSAPLTLADGRVTIGGNASVTVAPEDTGYFNYADYDQSLLRMALVELTASLKAGTRVTLLGGVRLQNTEISPFAGYVRVRVWPRRRIDLQAGRIPPPFGTFVRRAYGPGNPLIGEPLGYQYLVSLRPDAVPASTDELLRMRGRGWLSRYSIGDVAARHGVPLVSSTRWPLGAEVHGESDRVEATAGVTTGSVSSPDLDGGPQIAGRIAVHPVTGLVVGASVSRAAFLTPGAAQAAAPGSPAGDFRQHAFGIDAEYSRGYLLTRVETMASRWNVPAPGLRSPLWAVAHSAEATYKLRPGLYAAGRVDRVWFNEVTGSAGSMPWEAPVTRVELGAGYSIRRNLVAKLAFQHNARTAGRVRSLRLFAAQLICWL